MSHRLSVYYSVCPLYDDTPNFYPFVSVFLFMFVSLIWSFLIITRSGVSWTLSNFSNSMITVRHVTGTGSGLLGEIPRVVVQKSALL